MFIVSGTLWYTDKTLPNSSHKRHTFFWILILVLCLIQSSHFKKEITNYDKDMIRKGTTTQIGLFFGPLGIIIYIIVRGWAICEPEVLYHALKTD